MCLELFGRDNDKLTKSQLIIASVDEQLKATRTLPVRKMLVRKCMWVTDEETEHRGQAHARLVARESVDCYCFIFRYVEDFQVFLVFDYLLKSLFNLQSLLSIG